MAKVIVDSELIVKIDKKFKNKSLEVISWLRDLEQNPKKGDFLRCVDNIAIKEIKFRGFRFYFIVNNYRIKILKIEELVDEQLKFVGMSNKNNQDKEIDKIEKRLKAVGFEDY